MTIEELIQLLKSPLVWVVAFIAFISLLVSLIIKRRKRNIQKIYDQTRCTPKDIMNFDIGSYIVNEVDAQKVLIEHIVYLEDDIPDPHDADAYEDYLNNFEPIGHPVWVNDLFILDPKKDMRFEIVKEKGEKKIKGVSIADEFKAKEIELVSYQ